MAIVALLLKHGEYFVKPKSNAKSMKTRIFCAILAMLAGPLLAAGSSPKEELLAAAKKLGQKDNYAWNGTSEFSSFTSKTEGKANKDGLISLGITFGGNTTEAY